MSDDRTSWLVRAVFEWPDNDEVQGVPATEDDLAAIERAWGTPLPPSYRTTLEFDNGTLPLGFDVQLLSARDVVERAHRGSGSPDRPRWRVFAVGPRPHDALAFDPSNVDEQGEMAVVRLDGDEAREFCASFHILMYGLCIQRPHYGRDGHRRYCLWTNLWIAWPEDASADSRVFLPRQGGEWTAAEGGFFDRPREPVANAWLGAAELQQLDQCFERVAGRLPKESLLAVVLTESDANEACDWYYWYYEPVANVVLALGQTDATVALWAGESLWDELKRDFTALTEAIKRPLAAGHTAEALTLGIERMPELFEQFFESIERRR